MNFFAFFVKKVLKQGQTNQKEQQNHQQEASLIFHYPLSFPPREASNTPTINNIADITIATIEVLRFISSLTNGCTIAKTKNATAKLINPLPSSLRPLTKSIQKFYRR